MRELWIFLMSLLDTAMCAWYVYLVALLIVENPFIGIFFGWIIMPFLMLFEYPWIVIPYIILMELTIRMKT